jgi:LPS export ABC transporter protein LptC
VIEFSVKYVYVVIFFLLLISYMVFDRDQDYRRAPLIKTNSYIEGLRIVDRKDGKESWVITAKRADFAKDGTVAVMNAVTMESVKDGMTLEAGGGTYNLSTRELHLDDNIRIRIKDSVISAEHLSWDPASGLLTSADRVSMAGDRFRIEGDGVTATKDQKVKVMKNVRATFQ